MSGALPFADRPFDDGKADGALRTIGEVAAALGIKQHVLRYWEDQFPMLRPLKRGGGRRLYRREDVQLVARIDQLVHREGYTLRGARTAIEGGAVTVPVQAIAAPLGGISVQLVAIREGLAAALAG